MRTSLISAGLLVLAISVGPLAAQSSIQTFSFPDRGGASLKAAGASPTLQTGYARIGQTTAIPAGFALFGLQQGGLLVSEVTIPAANSVSAGRIYVETGGGVNTGIAIANTSSEPVPMAWYFTDSAGRQVSADVFTIPPNAQIAQFLSEPPFNIGAEFRGTFTFFALTARPDPTLAAIALRGLISERGEFLMTTLPVIPIQDHALFSSGTIPHFASGGGWATQIIFVNPTDRELGGTVTFFDKKGEPSVIESENGSSAMFEYRVSARSSWSLRTSSGGGLHLGSVKLKAVAGTELPIGFLVFSFAPAGITIATAGVPPARSASVSRLFVESSGRLGDGQPSSLQTGIAISNADSASSVRVSLELTTLDGTTTGLRGILDIPRGGQISEFLNEIPGLEFLPSPFQGVLRLSASAPVTTIGLRARYNERNDFIATTVPVVNENDEYFNSVTRYSNFVFPHFVDGAGYMTTFVLFSGWTAGPVSGALEFLTNTGAPLPLTLQAR